MILIVGSEGSQGKRYKAILDHLGRKSLGIDLISMPGSIDLNDIEGIILTTPTDTHGSLLLGEYLHHKIPVLIEKPVSKSLAELTDIILTADRVNTPLTMVYQYRHLVNRDSIGESSYNYFRHGGDGLKWDCLQIIALATGAVKLAESSPIWQCRINGHELNLSDMDRAYVKEIEDWLAGRSMSAQEILEIHEKVARFKL